MEKAQTNNTIIMTLEVYKETQRKLLKLQALEGTGVDNWQGYDDAMPYYHELLKEAGLEED